MSDNELLFTVESMNTARRRALETVAASIEQNDKRAFRILREAGESGEVLHLVLSLAVLVHSCSADLGT